MAQVTSVASPRGTSVKSTVLFASNGLTKSSLIVTRDDGALSVISMRPLPTALLPSHSYTAPLPLAAPLKLRFIAGSLVSYGDHAVQRFRSLISAKIRSGGASILAERWTRRTLGLVAA